MSKFNVGDRVAAFIPLVGSRWGSSAEYVAVKESYLCKIPDRVTFERAASVPLVGLTVVEAFDYLEGPTKGKKILIQAGAGGVGAFAIQYAKNVLEMEVTVTASRQKTELVQAIGADHVIDYRSENFTDIVKDYDVVLDPMSWKYESETLNQGNNILKKDGHYLNILSSGTVKGKEKTLGLQTFINLVKHKMVNLVKPGILPKYDLAIVKPDGEKLRMIFDLVEKEEIKQIIDPQIFGLYELADAHMFLEHGYATGKVVVRIQ